MRPQVPHPARRRLGMAAAAVAFVLVLAGCTSAVQQADKSQSPASSPHRGGVLHMVQATDIQPATIFSQNNPNFSVVRLVFNTLVALDHKTLKPQPELATDWTLSSDGLTLTFTLRDGVTFHDGKPFTADAVIGSIKTVQRTDVASQMKHVAKQITDMKATDDHHLTLTFAQPMSNVYDLFEMMPIVDPATVDQLLTGKQFNGTGPFKMQDYKPGQGFTLVRNDSYWKKGQPYLDGVDVSVVRDSQSMVSSLRAGQSQLALDVAPLDGKALASDTSLELVRSDANDSTYYVGSNVTVPLLSDKRVRQAISYAIDRDRILQQVFGGVGTVTSLPWSPSSPAYDKSLVNHFGYDVAKAKDLLAQAGATGASVKVYYDSGFAPNVGLAEIIQYDLTQAGLVPNMQPLQASDFLDKLRSGGFDGLFMTGHGFGQLSPATLVKGAFPYNADKNASSFDNQQYKDLANSLWKSPTLDPKVVQQMNEFLLDQQFVSDLVNYTHTYAISKQLKGLSWNMLDDIDLDEAYLG